MGVGRGVGKGVGRGFNRSFEQNRYCYIQFGYRYAFYETKSAEIAGNPRLQGASNNLAKTSHSCPRKVRK